MGKFLFFLSLVLAAAVSLAGTAPVRAGPAQDFGFAVAWDSGVAQTPTTDAVDPVAAYLGAKTLAAISNMDLKALVGSMGGAGLDPLPRFALPEPTIRTYNAPALPAVPPPMPPAELASFEYPQATGLGDLGSGGREVPLGDTTYFAMAPGGFGGVRTGRPVGGMENWCLASRTAISYIRPNVNIQMMFALDLPGGGAADAFEGPGFRPHAALAVDRETRIDSAEIGTGTTQFGRRILPVPVDEPQTAVAAGLDLGLLPTFLSQMGMGVSIVASRGEQTGDLRIALVGTTELPVDWTPEERPYQHPQGVGRDPYLVAGRAWDYPSGGVGEGRGPGNGGGGTTPTPIIPITPVPEPATLLVLAGGAAVLTWRRRRAERRRA